MPDNKPVQSQKQSQQQPAQPVMRFGPGGPMNRGMPIEKPKDSKGTLLRLIKYLSANIPFLIFIISLSIVASVVTIIATRISGLVLDEYIATGDMNGLFYICLLLSAIYIIGIITSYIQNRLMVKLSQSIIALIRKDLFGKVTTLPVGYYDTHSSGDIMSRLTNDVDNVGTTLSQNVAQLFSGVVSIIGTLIAMIMLNIPLTLITVLIVPVILFITKSVAKVTRKYFKKQSTELGELNGYIEEIISGEKVIKLFSREEIVKAEFAELNTRLAKSGTVAQSVSGVMGPLMNMVNNIAYLIITVSGAYLILAGSVKVGTVFVFLQYRRQFSMPIDQLANLFNTIQSALAAAERVFEIMDQNPETDSPGAIDLKSVNKSIEFDSVTFSYTKGKPALKNASLSVKKGTQIAIVGPTGAGKTTIISLLTRFYNIDSGSIRIDGIDINDLTMNSLRQNIGMVLQDTYLFSETVRDNIRYGSPDASDDEVEKAARIANAHSFIKHLPQGYDTVLNDNGSNLSQGQRQLLAIARAVLADSQVLILDEATSSVDTRTEINIQSAMLKLMENRTCFIIAHRLSTIRNADSIIVINDGEIIEQGTHNELIKIPDGFYAYLYNVQFSTGMAI